MLRREVSPWERLKDCCGEELSQAAIGLSLGSLECPFIFVFANVIYCVIVSNSATPFLTSLHNIQLIITLYILYPSLYN